MLPGAGYIHPDSMVSYTYWGITWYYKNPLAGGGKYNLDIYKNLNSSSIMFISVFISHFIIVSYQIRKR